MNRLPDLETKALRAEKKVPIYLAARDSRVSEISLMHGACGEMIVDLQRRESKTPVQHRSTVLLFSGDAEVSGTTRTWEVKSKVHSPLR